MFLRKPVAPYKAINLSQSNDYLAYASNPGCDLEHTDTFTISFWYCLADSVPGNVPIIISKQLDGDLNKIGWCIYLDIGKRINIRFCDGTGGTAIFRGNLASTFEWVHYVIQKTTTSVTGTYKFYHNGYRAFTTIQSSTYNTAISCLNDSDLIFGDAPGTALKNAKGIFKDFRIYKNKILTEGEIRRIYDLGRNQYKTYSYYLNKTPDVHLMRDPGIYLQPGGPGTMLMFQDELTKQFSLSGINVTSPTQVIASNKNPTPAFSSMTSVIRCKPSTFVNFSESLDVSYLYTKITGDGISYSRAASNQKVVGNFRVRFRNLTHSVNTKHIYIGLSNSNIIPSTITSTNLLNVAGFNNGGFIFYSAGTTIGSIGTLVNNKTTILSVDYDKNLVETYIENDNGTILPSYYFSCTTEHFGINKECYVIPYIFYNTFNREMYYAFWDFMNISNPGYLAPNDLI